MLTPREYQSEALEAVEDFRDEGITRQLISLPTGCGKTVIFALLAKKINVRTLVIAHTEELINQAVSKFKTVWPEVDIGIVKGKSDNIDAQVIVASVQTASKLKRLSKLKEQDFSLMIIDEAHHATASTYNTVIEELGFFTGSPDKLLVGVTATPKRSDGVGLGSVFQEIAFERSMNTMIRSGYLSPLLGKQVFTKVELSGVRNRRGDFLSSDLSKVINISERNNLIVDKYVEFALDRKMTLAFCVDVQHAKDLATAFQAKGISAKPIYGAMSQEERTEALRGFSQGKYTVLTNCQLLTEGFDEPSIDCVIMGRPTKSTSLFTQMIGRGTRTFPLKENCIVLDFTDNASKHNLCTYRNTLDGAVRSLLAEDDVEEVEEVEASLEEKTSKPVTSVVKVVEENTEDISFFDKTPFAWNQVGGAWHLMISKTKEIWVFPFKDGYTVIATQKNRSTYLSKRKLPLDYALGTAEDWARKQKTTFSRKDAPWRSEPASWSQKKLLIKYGVRVESNLSKGEASCIIDGILNSPRTCRKPISNRM